MSLKYTLDVLSSELANEIIRLITGQLFTRKQITKITSHAIGKYFYDWFPEPEEEIKAKERVETARKHISKASSIIAEMQSDLENQSLQLDHILEEIGEKKKLADRYSELAETSQKKFSAFKAEIEETLRNELILQSNQGKRFRQIASFILWIITLIAGAAMGSYFKDIISWIWS